MVIMLIGNKRWEQYYCTQKKVLPSSFQVCYVHVIGQDEIPIKALVDSQFLLSPTLIIHNHQ